MGPVTYLRRRRLSAAQTALKRSDRLTTTIADIAIEHGFPDPGRVCSLLPFPLCRIAIANAPLRRAEIALELIELAQTALLGK